MANHAFGFEIVFGRLEIVFGNKLLHPHVEIWAPFRLLVVFVQTGLYFLGAAFLALGGVSVGDAMAYNREMHKLMRRDQL